MATPGIQYIPAPNIATALSSAFTGGAQVGVSAANVRQRAVEAAMNARLQQQRMQLQAAQEAARMEMRREEMREDRIAQEADRAAKMAMAMREIQAGKDIVTLKGEVQEKLMKQADQLEAASPKGQMEEARLQATRDFQKMLDDPDVDPQKAMISRQAMRAFAGEPGYFSYLMEQARVAEAKAASEGGNTLLTQAQRVSLRTKYDDLASEVQAFDDWKGELTEDQLMDQEDMPKLQRDNEAKRKQMEAIGLRLGVKKPQTDAVLDAPRPSMDGQGISVKMRDGSRKTFRDISEVRAAAQKNQFSANPDQNDGIAMQIARQLVPDETPAAQKPTPEAAPRTRQLPPESHWRLRQQMLGQ